uniref:Uncharacterized protein n=1 Tax=Aegilops tauschii subsp. strangulata TaxID=200361 RepID=A0A453C0Y9_AEGTS
MDLLSGRVVHGCSPSWRGVKSLRFPPLLGSWAAGSSAFPGCSCALAVCRNGSAVVPFAKKKRKGYSVEPPDGEETKDGASDEIEGMVEDVDGEEEGGDEEDAGDDGMVLQLLMTLKRTQLRTVQSWMMQSQQAGYQRTYPWRCHPLVWRESSVSRTTLNASKNGRCMSDTL